MASSRAPDHWQPLGDYTRTEIDPANGMDFWHINQYAQAGNWHTRIGKFNFVGGASPTPTALSNWYSRRHDVQLVG